MPALDRVERPVDPVLRDLQVCDDRAGKIEADGLVIRTSSGKARMVAV
jgi:hypothetical protein